MAYCTYCGSLLETGARFCSNCGAAVTAETLAVETAAAASVVNTVEGDNQLMLLSLGSCTEARAMELITALCGYSRDEALQIVRSTPITIARGLQRQQAVYLAQAMTEAGLNVSLYDGRDYLDVTSDLDTVYDSKGSLLASVAGELGLIGVKNRIERSLLHRSAYPYTHRQPPVFRAPRREVPPQPRPVQPARPVQPKPAVQPRPAQPQPVHGQPVRQAAPKAAPNHQPAHPAQPARQQPRQGGHGPQGGGPRGKR